MKIIFCSDMNVEECVLLWFFIFFKLRAYRHVDINGNDTITYRDKDILIK